MNYPKLGAQIQHLDLNPDLRRRRQRDISHSRGLPFLEVV